MTDVVAGHVLLLMKLCQLTGILMALYEKIITAELTASACPQFLFVFLFQSKIKKSEGGVGELYGAFNLALQ